MRAGILICIFSLSLLAGCGTETVTDQPDTQAGPPDPYGDPPGYTGDPFAGFGPVNSISLPAEGSGTEPSHVAEVHRSGSWCVQVAACGTQEAAMSLRDVVQSITDEPVYVDHIGSYYKVRVGAFETAEQTTELRMLLRSSGYGDAWSVERETTP